MTFTATYSPDDNKLRLYASSRLDAETYARVTAAGFSWAPRQELFVAPKWTPEREDLLLELCGEIGDEDTSLVDRAAERAERFEDYSDKREADAHAARAAVSAIADNIPLGQPILVGHHSERHARRDAEKIESGMRRSLKMWETSKYWERRAAGAISHAKYKERPDVRSRRIKTIETDQRREQKALKEAELFLKLWRGAHLDAAAKKRDGSPTTFAERAHYLANVGRDYSLYSDLDHGKITPEAAQVLAVDHLKQRIARAGRWLTHYDNRLGYERAMLAASGWTPPPKPKTKADLPLLNYDGEVAYRDPYHHGQIVRQQAVGITKAALAAIGSDYKGTRLSACGTHRVRMAVLPGHRLGHGTAVVYLTDSKQHPRPGSADVAAVAQAEEDALENRLDQMQAIAVERASRAPNAAERAEKEEREAPFVALRRSLDTGVEVVVADQLFATPAALARRMVELAELEPGLCVLEPNGGTGALIQAVLDAVDTEVLAYEINRELCSALEKRFPSYKLQVRCKDFLTVTDFAGCYPRILMNPPFARGQDVAHILHARGMLAPGGRLVALCADGPRQRAVLEPIALSYESLPPDTFKEQGTSVRVALVVLEAK